MGISLFLLTAAVILAVAAVVLLRLEDDRDPTLDRTSKERIRRRIDALDRRTPVATLVATASATPTVALSARRRLWRDTSGLLVLFGAIVLAVLSAASAMAPTGAVLDVTSAPHESPAASPDVAATAEARPGSAASQRPAAVSPAESPGAEAGSTPPPLSPPSTRPTPHLPREASDRMAVIQPCPGTADCYIYVVQPGDNLMSIANWFGVPYDQLVARNPQLRDPSRLYAGDRISLPRPTR